MARTTASVVFGATTATALGTPSSSRAPSQARRAAARRCRPAQVRTVRSSLTAGAAGAVRARSARVSSAIARVLRSAPLPRAAPSASAAEPSAAVRWGASKRRSTNESMPSKPLAVARARAGRAERGRAIGMAPGSDHAQPAALVDDAAGPAGVVGVQAVRHVEMSRVEGEPDGAGRGRRRVRGRSSISARASRAMPVSAGAGVARSACCASAAAAGVLERVDVVLDGRDPVRLGRRLDDEPLGAASDGQPRARAQDVERARARCAGRRPCRCRGRRASRAPSRYSPASERSAWSGLEVLLEVGLLRVAQRDARHAVLAKEDALQERDRDQQAGRAQLAEQAAAEALQVDRVAGLARAPAARSSATSRRRRRPAACGCRAGSTRPGRPRWLRCRPRPASGRRRYGSAEPCRTWTGKSPPARPASMARVARGAVGDDREPVEVLAAAQGLLGPSAWSPTRV